MYKNSAFTLPEILIAMVILGVTMLVGYSSFQNYEERTIARSYAKAYETLSTAAFNIQNEVVEYNKKKNFEAQEKGLATADANDLKRFPFEPSSNTIPAASKLRNKLMEYINNKGSYGSAPSSFSSYDNFIASDGMVYYFESAPVGKFYVVWVDINGSRRPNTKLPTGVKYPDIVPFLVHSELGEVVPAGYPAYNSKYSISRVIYSNPDKTVAYSAVMTFRQAQYAAYQGKSFVQDPFSQTRSITKFDETIPSGFTKPGESADTSCYASAYNVASDFPPCTVQVNTKF